MSAANTEREALARVLSYHETRLALTKGLNATDETRADALLAAGYTRRPPSEGEALREAVSDLFSHLARNDVDTACERSFDKLKAILALSAPAAAAPVPPPPEPAGERTGARGLRPCPFCKSAAAFYREGPEVTCSNRHRCGAAALNAQAWNRRASENAPCGGVRPEGAACAWGSKCCLAARPAPAEQDAGLSKIVEEACRHYGAVDAQAIATRAAARAAQRQGSGA